MILGPISLLDCVIFLIFLIPQLLLQVPLSRLVLCGLSFVPFFAVQLPFGLLADRLLTARVLRPPFVQRATFFQDLVIRCVRFAFAKLPASVGRVFFSKHVALPFTRFRMLRHGILRSPVHWEDIEIPARQRSGQNNSDQEGSVKGVWIGGVNDSAPPDLVVYYCHGGGFSMGSAYFYLEPLLALRDLLLMHYRNPAIFALEYSLVPDRCFPVQLNETLAGYEYVLSCVRGDASRICVAGDSAGGTLAMSLLLHLANQTPTDGEVRKRPGYAFLISPWAQLLSDKHRNTTSDYLNRYSLHLYGRQYAGSDGDVTNPLLSPGDCTSGAWWLKASPTNGFYCTWGSEEVFGPDIVDLVRQWRQLGIKVTTVEEPGGIHAWVIAALFLEDSMAKRSAGMRSVVNAITANIKN